MCSASLVSRREPRTSRCTAALGTKGARLLNTGRTVVKSSELDYCMWVVCPTVPLLYVVRWAAV